jgi:NAD(P)-dependent dehydrogenase (short-subunit alcohol dehydrogenase family)
MQTAQERFGALHVLVNNAGIQTSGNVATATEEDWDRVMGVNLRGAWYCCKHAIPLMIDQGGGSIINIASTHAFRTQRNYFPYHSSKAGMMAMTLGICIDFGEKGIRANNICPGYIETPLTREYMRQVPNREVKERVMLASHPLRRFGRCRLRGRFSRFR